MQALRDLAGSQLIAKKGQTKNAFARPERGTKFVSNPWVSQPRVSSVSQPRVDVKDTKCHVAIYITFINEQHAGQVAELMSTMKRNKDNTTYTFEIGAQYQSPLLIPHDNGMLCLASHFVEYYK